MMDKPLFDPSQPFTTATADKPAFDPSAAFSTKPPELSWSDVPLTALGNVPQSAVKFGSDIVQPFLHPIDTISAIGTAGHGLSQKLGLSSGEEDIPAADAVGQYFKDRYGSAQGFKKAVAEDPIGVIGDLSTVFTAGGSLAARAPGIAGRVGEVVGSVGRAIDPLNAAVRAATPIVRETAGVMSGVGSDPLQVAYSAGRQGGQAAEAFRENITGRAPLAEVVEDARGAVQQMRRERGNAYRQEMARVGADDTVLDFSQIDNAVAQAQGVKTYRGRSGTRQEQNLSPRTDAIRTEMENAIEHWRSLDPDEFHTAEGIDALKQQLGDIRDATQYGTPERVAADAIYRAVRQTIVDQVPEYARVMHGYEQASNQIREIEKTLSANPNASIDTALRKLQSVLRNNVNTSYGQRRVLAQYLVNSGAPHLMEKLAGQTLQQWAPRGIARVAASQSAPALGGLFGAHAAGAAGAGLGAGLGALATIPMMSPRTMGELAFGAGRAAHLANPALALTRVARQLSHIKEAEGQ